MPALTEAQGKKLGDLYPRAEPEMSPEEQLRLQQEMQRRFQEMQNGGGPSGMLEAPTPRSTVWESPDVPAAWMADDQPAGGAGSAAPAAGSAAPAAGSAAPAAGSAAPAAGSAAPAAVPPAPVAAVDLMKPSADILPTLGTMEKPSVRRVGPLRRSADDAGIGTSKEVVTALFDEIAAGGLAPRIYKIGGAYAVIQVVDKKLAEIAIFEKDADKSIADLARERGEKALSGWLRARCKALKEADKISFLPALISQTDEQGKALPSTYSPCMTMQ